MDYSSVSDIYDTLQGVMEPYAQIQGVKDAFAPGTVRSHRYEEITAAYERLRNRLGVTDEDLDVEIIINSFMDIQKELCFKMYAYGAQFGTFRQKAR